MNAVVTVFGPLGVVLRSVINNHTNTSLIFITFRFHYSFAAQYFHKGFIVGSIYQSACFLFLCVYVFLGILCSAFLGRKFYGSFWILFFPQSLRQLGWIGRLLHFNCMYRPAVVAMEGFYTSHAVVYPCQHMLSVLTLNRQNVFHMGCLDAVCCMRSSTFVLRIRQCDSLTRANLGTALNQYGVRDRGVSALRGRMFPFTPISFLLLSLSFFPFFHISSTFVVLSLPN